MASLSRQEAQEFFIDGLDLLCLECYRQDGDGGEYEGIYFLKHESLGADGVWRLVCVRDLHSYTVTVQPSPSRTGKPTITMTWLGAWDYAPIKGD